MKNNERNIKNLHPIVFRYQVLCLRIGLSNLQHIIKEHSNAVCYKNNNPTYVAFAYNIPQLHKLFQKVYNDCIYNCL